MRLILCAVAFLLAWSSNILAQGGVGQPPNDKTSVGDAAQARQAPIGHRQPSTKDLPADVLQREQKLAPSEQRLDKNLTICKGC